MKNIFYLLLLAILATACSHPKPKATEKPKLKDSISVADTSFLADKNFAYKNASDLSRVWIERQYNYHDLYADSTRKVKFVELLPALKAKIIAPFLSKDQGTTNLDFIKNEVMAHFIAKQDKIGDVQPILVMISGGEYESLTMILLDKNNKFVDGVNLFGGLDSGPYQHGDTLMIFPVKRTSVLDKGKVIIYESTRKQFADSLKLPTIIDSNVFVSSINKEGKVVKKLIKKASYNVPYVPHN